MDCIPDVDYNEYTRYVYVTDEDGNEIRFAISEARDLGRTLIALADEAGE